MQQNLEIIFENDRKILKKWLQENYPHYLNKLLNHKIIKKNIVILQQLIPNFNKKLFETYLRYLNFLNLNKVLIKCKTCGKYLPYKYVTSNTIHIYCSNKCSMPDKLVQMKITNLKKYGVENTFQSQQLKEKSKQTMLKRYGVTHPAYSNQIINKRKNTLITHYGVQHPLQNKEILEKTKQTCFKKYGTSSYTKTKEFKQKFIATNILKYKCTNHEFLDKWNHMNNLEIATPLFILADIENFQSKKYYLFKCNFCGKTFLSMWKCRLFN